MRCPEVREKQGNGLPTRHNPFFLGGKHRLKHVLFLCSHNRLRSPTAERVFADWPGVETQSAGLATDADSPLDAETLDWADIIVVMEKSRRRRLQERFGTRLRGQRVICLDIPDDYDYMQPELVALLRVKVAKLLPVSTRTAE